MIKLLEAINGLGEDAHLRGMVISGNGKTGKGAYEDAANEVAKFIVDEFAEGKACPESGCTTSGAR